MSEISAYESPYQGERAIWLKCGKYEAAVLPEIGANLVAFRDTEKGYSFLHEPKEDQMEAFRNNPVIYGIPVLFPPNRYRDGKFAWQDKVYQFPVNEEKTGNHLHGFLHTIPWEVVQYGANECESSVTLKQQVHEGHDVYRHFPHRFTLMLTYSLSEDGLSQKVFLRNDGEELLPCTLAFHTTINAPFAPGSKPEDYKVKLTAGERWELDDRMLPTGKFQPLTGEEKQLISDGVYPFFEAMDNHYTAVPQNGRNRMELTDTHENVTLIYDVGTSYKQWMIWNNFATTGFFCPEPQVNLVNAPNAVKEFHLSAEEIGLFSLKKGEIWEETSRIYCTTKTLS